MKENLTDKQYAMLATNIAYILTAEPIDDNSEKEAFDYLTEAVKRKSVFPETYYGLGMHFFKNNDLKNALKYLNKAIKLSDEEKYISAYTVCLANARQYDKAEKYIQFISEKSLQLLLSAVCIYHKNDYAKTKTLLDSIKEADYGRYSYHIARLYLAIGEYQKYADIINKENFLFDKEIAHSYAFAMSKLEKSKHANRKLKEIIEENDEIIATADVSDFANKKSYNQFINEIKNENAEIASGFAMKNIKPIYKFDLSIEQECFYIGCPRHLNK